MSDSEEKIDPTDHHLPRASDGIYAAATRSMIHAASMFYRNPMKVFRPQAIEVENH